MPREVLSKARYVAALGSAAALVAACGSGDNPQTMTSLASDFQACMVTDLGGVDDKSFNETSYNGLVKAHDDGLTTDPLVKESDALEEYGPNISDLINSDCDLIVTVGFLLGTDTEKAANANPDQRFAIVDFQYTDPDTFEVYEIENVKPLVFNTQEAAYLAGYLAAAYSETGTVGTFGGLPIGTVTIFMDGFVDGVAKYNEVKDADVEVLGWDKEAQEGEFVGDFENHDKAAEISRDMVAQGADILLPVAGPLAEDAAKVAQEAGNVAVIWVDSDGVEAAPDYKDVILTSVLKGMDVAVSDTVAETVNANYTNVPYIGTLANGGVGLAPFHEFDDEIPPETKQELAKLQRQIIIGELNVKSSAAHQ